MKPIPAIDENGEFVAALLKTGERINIVWFCGSEVAGYQIVTTRPGDYAVCYWEVDDIIDLPAVRERVERARKAREVAEKSKVDPFAPRPPSFAEALEAEAREEPAGPLGAATLEGMRPLYIFDLDGTLALIDRRKHFLEDKHDPQRWRKFYAACDTDLPNRPVIDTMERLRHMGCEVWIFSGRSDEVRDKTVAWLAQHTSFMTHDLETALVMRREGDYTADDTLKAQWAAGMLQEDRARLVAVFDDRDRVVAMWRGLGIACFQVRESTWMV